MKLGENTFLETGPRILMAFMHADKKVETLDIFLSKDNNLGHSGDSVVNTMVHQADISMFLDEVNTVIELELDIKSRPEHLSWSHWYVYLHPNGSMSNLMSQELRGYVWTNLCFMVLDLAGVHQIVLEQGERCTWKLHIVDRQKSPEYLSKMLQYQEQLQLLEVF